MPSNTLNYNLTLYDRTADENQQFLKFREDIAGTIVSSNMNKIDKQMKVNADAINEIAGVGRTTETVKQNADNIEQLKDGVIHEVTTIGTDIYGGTSSTISSYYNGQKILLKPANDNTGNSILNINELGAKSLRKVVNGSEVELDGGDLKQNHPQLFEYNGISWVFVGNTGEGDMPKDVYDPNNIQSNAFDMTNMVNGGIKKAGNGYALDNGSTRPTLGDFAVDLNWTDDNTKGATGVKSHAEGSYTTASAYYSHAEGYITTASGFASHAECGGTIASGNRAHAEGFNTTASGSYGSHAEGYNTIASGDYGAHAEGLSTDASGNSSHAQNHGTCAQGYAQTAIGLYNILQGTSESKVDTDHAFIIGNGTDSGRSNALTVNWQGDLLTAGDITDGYGNVLSGMLPITGGTLTGTVTFAGGVSGIEGGQVQFAKAPDGTSTTNPVLDVYGDSFRMIANPGGVTKVISFPFTAEGTVWTSGNLDINKFIYGDNERGTTVSSDFNTITKSGFYYGEINSPTGGWGYLLHEQYHDTVDYAKQTYQPYNSTDIYVRKKEGGTWDAWYKIFTEQNFDPQDHIHAEYNTTNGGDQHIRIPNPGGAYYSSNNSNNIGAVKITLPQSWTATMMSFWIDIYNYIDNETTSFLVGGYNYTTSSLWTRTSTMQFNGTPLNVRFGHDGSKCCILIGEVTTIWSYAKITVRDFVAGFNGVADDWKDGWDIDIVDTLPSNIDSTIQRHVLHNENFDFTPMTYYSSDADLITKPGLYFMGTSATNKPANGVLLHGKYTTTSNNYDSQLLMSHSSNSMHFRSKDNGVWESWKEVYHTGNDGAGSGLDADTVDGAHLSTDGTMLSNSDTKIPTEKAVKVYVDNNSGDSIPSGVIVMWSGSTASIPSGWVLCNGTNGTPDLRNRFIVGVGNSYSVGATGGIAMHILTIDELPSHNHTGSTNSTGSHSHNIKLSNSGSKDWKSALSSMYGSYYGNSVLQSSGNHNHTVTINNTGSGSAHENRPPYYALAYIMKL